MRETAIEAPLTEWLQAWARGGQEAADALLEQVYQELLRAARRVMLGERRNHTLEPTALVHEAFLRLAGNRGPWLDRTHFFAVAARLMRRILIDHARAARRGKRGGGAARVSLLEPDQATPPREVDVIALEDALERLAARAPEQVRMVELHYFGGLSYDEIADVLGLSRASVGRKLRFARAWLRRRLGSG